jgi:N-acetylmuramoyl-L-alanine amidase
VVKGANVYDVWRDGRFLTRLDRRGFVDRTPGVGRHRYEVRAAQIAGVFTVQESRSAVAEAVVPYRIVVDPGHGGSEPGAVGRY